MRAWIENHRQAAVLVGLTLAVPLCLLLYLAADFLALRQEYQRQIDQLEPRIARLSGLVASEQSLEASATAREALLRDLAYLAGEDRAAVSAALQNNVREIASDAGLTVSDSQVLKIVQEGGFDRIGVKLTLSGDIAALETALLDLTTYVPLLLVESIEIWPDRQSRRKQDQPAQTLTARVQLLALRSLQ